MKKTIVVGAVAIFLAWGAKEFYDQLIAMTGMASEPSGPSKVQAFRESMRKEASLASLSPAARAVGLPKARGAGGVASDSPGGTGGSTFLPVQTSREAADLFLSEHRAQWNVQEHHSLRPTVYESPLGTKVKYQVYQDDVPVFGIGIELDVSKDRVVTATENTYQPLKKVDLSQPFLTQEEVVSKNAGRYTLDEKSTAGVSRILYMSPGSDEPELSYVIPVTEASSKQPVSVIFRAADGQVLGRQAGRSEF